ncbi:hypothetical protein FQN54_008795 [Arachnomyces sp. PD_36]|nr:hypothetical protein FQN54_008795 [Arachnomyces sp. PD_36]
MTSLRQQGVHPLFYITHPPFKYEGRLQLENVAGKPLGATPSGADWARYQAQETHEANPFMSYRGPTPILASEPKAVPVDRMVTDESISEQEPVADGDPVMTNGLSLRFEGLSLEPEALIPDRRQAGTPPVDWVIEVPPAAPLPEGEFEEDEGEGYEADSEDDEPEADEEVDDPELDGPEPEDPESDDEGVEGDEPEGDGDDGADPGEGDETEESDEESEASDSEDEPDEMELEDWGMGDGSDDEANAGEDVQMGGMEEGVPVGAPQQAINDPLLPALRGIQPSPSQPCFLGPSPPRGDRAEGWAREMVGGLLDLARSVPAMWELLVGWYFQEGRNPGTYLAQGCQAQGPVWGVWEPDLLLQARREHWPEMVPGPYLVPQGPDGDRLQSIARDIMDGNEDVFLFAIRTWHSGLIGKARNALENILCRAGWCDYFDV